MAKKKKRNILSLENPDIMEYSVLLEDERDIHKFINRVEAIVRSSMEYRDYIVFLKDNVNMDKCAFFNNVENVQGNKVRIEVHHDPLTLYDITLIILSKYLDEGLPISDLYIAEEIVENHYINMVGLIPLSKSLHQIVHNSNEITIPLSLIYGNYKGFIEKYEAYISDELMDKLERKIHENKIFKESMVDKLTPNFVYVNVDGFDMIKKIPSSSNQTA